MKRLFSTLILFYLFIIGASAQEFGNHPPSIKWKQIDTDTVRIIFPEGMEKQARRSASLVHYMYSNNRTTIGNEADKIDIVFRNQTTIPNGFVALPLFRSEFFTTPPSNAMLSALDWNDALTLHEYRHVLQYLNAKKGMGEAMYWLSGEGGWAAFAGFMIPDWFFEGDAVVTETVLSDSGRGRTPHFNLDQRAMLLNNRDFNYMKARNNSYKDMVPDHYQLGYVMSKYIREHYGDTVWRKVIRQVTGMSGFVYPFSKNLEKYTGITTRELYKEAYKELKDKLQKELEALQLTDSKRISLQKYKTFTNYRHPQLTETGDLLAIKNSFKEIASVVRIKNGKEEKLVDLGPSVDPHMTYRNGKLAWTELIFDKRWTNRDYSVVVTYDLTSGRKTYLTDKTKYFSPHFSPDGSRIAVAELGTQQNFSLKILDARNGKELKTITHPDGLLLRSPRWTADGKTLVALAQKNSRFSLVKYSLEAKSWETLLAPTAHVMGGLFVHENRLFFHASFSGIDNIYALDLQTKEVMQLTSVKVGAFHPAVSIDGEQFIFREYGKLGFEIRQMNLDEALWHPVEIEEPVDMEKYAIRIAEAEGGSILKNIKNTEFEVKDYKPGLRTMKLHSWIPFATNTEAGVNLLAENLLHTWQADLGAKYNFNENVPITSLTFNYGGWYPKLSIGGSAIPGMKGQTGNEELSELSQEFIYDQYVVNAGVSVPLVLSKGAYSRGLKTGISMNHRWIKIRNDDAPSIQSSYMQPYLVFNNLKRKAYQLHFPRWGQSLSVTYQKELGADNSALVANGQFYFPGIGITHNFYTTASYRKQVRNGGTVGFVDGFGYARGYNPPVNANGVVDYDDIIRLSANYHMPVWYPDFGFAGLIYLKRVRNRTFYDFSMSRTQVEMTTDLGYFRSAGTEFFLDLQGFNNRALQVGVGVRGVYLFDDDPVRGPEARPYRFELVFQNIL